MKLSVLIPVYNERGTLGELLRRVKASPYDKELIVVDDFSTDGSRELLQQLAASEGFRLVLHDRNRGKGAAIRSAIPHITGDVAVIQDADLEYDPEDYPALVGPILDGRADVVYGSRFLGLHRVFLFWHYIGNRVLSFVTSALYNTHLSDMETCYKAFRADVIKSIPLRSDRFNIEPEMTAKLFKRGYRVFEVPISYAGRNIADGKKITWRDGIWALWALVKYRFVD